MFTAGHKTLSLNLCITTRCNRMCPHCCVGVGKFPFEDMTVDQVKELGRVMGKIDVVQITGGEPTIHPQLSEIAREARRVFGCTELRLFTNADRPIPDDTLRLFSHTYISWYTKNTHEGSRDNEQEVVRLVHQLDRLRASRSVMRNLRHLDGLHGGGICLKGSNSFVSYWAGKLYPCCAAHGYEGAGIKVNRNWRQEIMKVELPCSQCPFSLPNRSIHG